MKIEFPRTQLGRRINRQFNYVPRYYDEDKEELDERVENARSIPDNDRPENYANRIRSGFQSKSQPLYSNKNKMALISRLRVFMIAVILGLLLYLLFYTDTIYFIFEAFDNA